MKLKGGKGFSRQQLTKEKQRYMKNRTQSKLNRTKAEELMLLNCGVGEDF